MYKNIEKAPNSYKVVKVGSWGKRGRKVEKKHRQRFASNADRSTYRARMRKGASVYTRSVLMTDLRSYDTPCLMTIHRLACKYTVHTSEELGLSWLWRSLTCPTCRFLHVARDALCVLTCEREGKRCNVFSVKATRHVVPVVFFSPSLGSEVVAEGLSLNIYSV